MVEVNNSTKRAVDKSALVKIAETVLKGENTEEKDISVALVAPDKMRELNLKYRKIDKPTDVLSFGESMVDGGQALEFGQYEVVICPEIVRVNAKNYNMGYNKELARVLIHGILHVLGYDHEKGEAEAKKMSDAEDYYLNKLKKV